MTQQHPQRKSLAPSEHKRLDVRAEFKFTGKTGHFEGYASIFGNEDLGGDVVLPGAFQEIVKTGDGHVLVLYQHDTRDPIGKATVTQDARGLRVSGDLILDDPTAAKAYALMNSGVLDGMSIGYDILPGGAAIVEGRRELSALKLWEVSIVTFGMNPAARIETVKSAKDCTNPRELERLLRGSPLSLSARKARAAANALWPILNEREAQEGDRDDQGPEAARLKAMADELKSLTSTL